MAAGLRITGAKLLTMEAEGTVLEGMDLWIADGRIVAVTPKDAAPPIPAPFETLSFPNGLVMPGLVNSHSHSSSAIARGCIAGEPLDLFVLAAMARRALDLRQVRVAVLLQAIEMLKSGCTAVVDHLRHGVIPSLEAVGIACDAYEEIGLRAAVAPMFEDRPYVESLPIDVDALPGAVRDRWKAMPAKQPDPYFEMLDGAVALVRGRPLLQLLIGVDGPQRCTPALLERTGDFARRHGIGHHTHLLEAKTQALMAPEGEAGSFVQLLDRYGLIGPKSSLAHFVWCTDRDIELAAARGVNVVNNPGSNLLLGSGLQPTARLLREGVNVALGSDGSSGGPANLFDQMRLTTLLSRISEPDSTRWMTAWQALRMATVQGGRVLGRPGEIGMIRAGAQADLCVLDLSTPVYRPMGEIANHLVMYENGRSVDTVIVAGEIVVRNGRCTRIDEDAIYAEADAVAAASAVASAPTLGLAAQERPAFEPLIHDALRRPAPVERFAQLA